jgi:hypothetical protein
MIYVAAVALVHEHDVHPRCQAVSRYTVHVLRIGGAFETVDDDQSERRGAIRLLPITPAADLGAGLNLDQALLGGWQMDIAGQKETGDGLHMATTQPSAWAEWDTGCP